MRVLIFFVLVGAGCGGAGGAAGGGSGGGTAGGMGGGAAGGVGGGAAGGMGGGTAGGMGGGSGGGVAGDAGTFDHSAPAITAFVRDGGYKSWRAETSVHQSTGPHGGNVRTWVNDLLYASLKAGNTTHPLGSITVKELYGSSTSTLTGHAVNAKDSAGTWTFYEGFAPTYANPYYFRGTSNFCGSCHQSGPDYYRGLLTNLP